MKTMKRIAAVLLAAVMACSLFACGKTGGVDPQKFVKQFNKACTDYQIDVDQWSGKESGNNMVYTYTFQSENSEIGNFMLSAFTEKDSSDIYRISILLPFGTYSSAGNAISENRRAAFLSITRAVIQVIKHTNEADANNLLNSFEFQENEIYNKTGTTSDDTGGFKTTYGTVPLLGVSTFSIENTALAPTTASSTQA